MTMVMSFMLSASRKRSVTEFGAGALLLLNLSLGGCAASTTGSPLDARAEAPSAFPKTSAYLPVGETPPERPTPLLTPDERSKLKQELLAARDRQASAVKDKPVAEHP